MPSHLQRRLGWAGRAITPPAITRARDSVAFGRRHGLSSPPTAWLDGYRSAFRFGLHYLPAGFTLDGLIVDIGANEGSFTAMIRRLEPRARVLAVEPGPAARHKLTQRFAQDSLVSIDGHALSDQRGTAVFHIPQHDVYASLLKPNGNVPTPTLQQMPVEMALLDDLVREPVRLIKLDVQGHEIPVLRGGSRVLASTDAVILEVLFLSMYEGDALFGSLDSYMREAGFTLTGLTEAHRKDGLAVYSAACYLRR
jgi:FkbM family methyltransferase